MITRRSILTSAAAITTTLTVPTAATAKPASFVRRDGAKLTLDGKPYRFAGANLWYLPWLGAPAAYGNRDRLRRELDTLAGIGVTNLRIAAGGEDSPLKNSVKPAFRTSGKAWNPDLVAGLDYTLAEMKQRGMHAVLYLTNFWEWSGGMMTYLSWVNGGKFMDMNDPAHPWPEFPNMTAQFYASDAAVGLYHDWVRYIVARHRGDPTIMAWQLANEPRPGGDAAVAARFGPAYNRWIQSTAKLIKSISPDHLVSTGSEGLKGAVESLDVLRAAHAFPEIDYLTAHIWPLNWSWVDAKDLPGTHDAGAAKVAEYLEQHETLAREMGKPLVIEEFGYPRDGGGYDPQASTAFKDRYYRQIYAAVLASAQKGGPVAGSNFWSWNGEGRAVHGDHRFRTGDTSWLGDPPHEPQGWYGVYDSDTTTRALIAEHAKALAGLG